MARTIFLILVSINVTMLAWVYLNSSRHEMAGREPQRATLQLQPEKIRIVDPLAKEAIACQTYSGAALPDAQELAKTWGAQFPAVAFNVTALPTPSTFEAVIAGFSSRAAAAARLGDMRALGVADAFVVRAEEGGKFSIVASFADRFGAEAKQRAAVQKGVAGVSIVERPAAAPEGLIQARGAVSMIAPVAALAAAKNLVVANCP